MRRPLLFWSFCLVALIAFINMGRPADTWCGPPDGSRITVTGQICDKDENSFELKNLKILSDVAVLQQDNSNQKYNFIQRALHMEPEYDRLMVSYEGASKLILGSDVTVEGAFYTFSQAGNPGEFDYASYYHAMGYGGRMGDAQILRAEGKAGIREYLFALRMFWKERLYRVFPDKEASVMAAILLGEKSDVDAKVKALYQRNGIVHILSISGVCTLSLVSLRPP